MAGDVKLGSNDISLRLGGVMMKMKHFKKLTLSIAVLVLTGLVWGYGLERETIAKPAPTVESKAPMVPRNFRKLAEEARPSVVNIRTVKTIKGGSPVFRHFFKAHSVVKIRFLNFRTSPQTKTFNELQTTQFRFRIYC